MAGKNSVFLNNNPPQVDDAWLNIITSEQKNIIMSSGQALSDGDLNQVSKAMANYAAISTSYNDIGSVNTYNLSPIGNLKTPDAYYDKMVVRYRPANTNTGASTIAVGTLGSKSIKKADGVNDVIAGDISTSADIMLRYDGTNFRIVSQMEANSINYGSSLIPNRIIISNNVLDPNNDIDFAAGNFIFSDKSGQAVLSSLLTKRTDATWVAGNNQGGLDTGTVTANTWYHCFAIFNPSTFTTDCLFSLSPTSPTLPSGYTKFGRVGSIRAGGGGNILSFTQNQNYFQYTTAVSDIAVTMSTGSRTLYTVTLPLGIITLGSFEAALTTAAAVESVYAKFTSPAQADVAASSSQATIGVGNGSTNGITGTFPLPVQTNTSSQIGIRGSAARSINVRTIGWTDLQL